MSTPVGDHPYSGNPGAPCQTCVNCWHTGKNCPKLRKCGRPKSDHLAFDDQPVSDPSETLALIAEHRLMVSPAFARGVGGWGACAWKFSADLLGTDIVREGDPSTYAEGFTIGDAVRACVARIKDGRS